MIKNSHKYFSYHSPKTEKRIKLHNINNDNCYNLFVKIQQLFQSKDEDKCFKIHKELMDYNLTTITNFIHYNIVDEISKKWAIKALTNIYDLIKQTKTENKENIALEQVQFLRMSINQGITVDELIGEKNENK